jgi:hypothetical protein
MIPSPLLAPGVPWGGVRQGSFGMIGLGLRDNGVHVEVVNLAD